MEHKQVTAVLLSIILAASACVPTNRLDVFAAENTVAAKAAAAVEQRAAEADASVPDKMPGEELNEELNEEPDETADEAEAPEQYEKIYEEPNEAAEPAGESDPNQNQLPEEDAKDQLPEEDAQHTESEEQSGTEPEAPEAEEMLVIGENTESSDPEDAIITEDEAATPEAAEPATPEAAEPATPEPTPTPEAPTNPPTTPPTEFTQSSDSLEILDSAGITETGSRESKAASASIDVDDLLSREIIPTDVSSASSGCVLVGLPGEYISDPDAALARINEIRWEACVEGVRDPRTGQPLTTDDYVEIKWSSDLEYIARIRAAESALTGEHERTNGEGCFEITGPGGNGAYGEVLAWNWTKTMTRGIDQWYGEKSDWVNKTSGAVTGHYTAMINPRNKYVGLGTFCSNAAYYYNTTAGEFSSRTGLNESRMSFTGECVQLLEMPLSNLSANAEIAGKLYAAPGETSKHLLAVKPNYPYAYSNAYLMSGVNWSSSDTSVVTISANGETTARQGGTATIRAASSDGGITAEAEFVVKGIQNCEIDVLFDHYIYTGKEKRPPVLVTYQNTELTEGTDYTVSYSDNIDAGTATVTVTGMGEFGGSDTRTFTIEKAEQVLSFDKSALTMEADTTETVTVTGCKTTLSFDSTNMEVADVNANGADARITGIAQGSAFITVEAAESKNYYWAMASLYVTVTPISISRADITVTDAVYDGTAKKPGISVSYGAKILTESTDYTVTCASNINAGTYNVTISGTGDFKGSVVKNYKIAKAEQPLTVGDLNLHPYEKVKVSVTGAQGALTYRSSNAAVAAVAAGGTVTAGQAGTAKITVNAAETSNYKAGSTELTAKVTAYDLSSSDCIAELATKEFVYDGTQKKPAVSSVKFGNVALTEGTDFTVSYKNNTNAGTASVTITGNSKTTTGSRTLNFTIRKAEQTLSADGLKIRAGESAKAVIKGAQGKITYKIADSAIATVASDGTVTAVEKGTTTLTVNAAQTANYNAAKPLEITVVVRPATIDVSELEITVDDAGLVYNGKAREPKVTVKYEGDVVTEGFTVEYENNIVAGDKTAKVIITGDDDIFEGTRETAFTILPGKTTRGDMFNLANNVKVTWKEVPGAKYYKVYRSGVKEPVIVTSGLVGWDKEPGLVNGQKYTYKIVASLTGKGDPGGDSPLSYSKVMYRLKTVVIRSVKNTAPGKVTVKYDKTTSGDSYVLQYCEREDMVGAKTKVVLGASNTSYVIGGLKKGQTYYISIRVRKKVNGIDYYTTFGVPKKIKITQ